MLGVAVLRGSRRACFPPVLQDASPVLLPTSQQGCDMTQLYYARYSHSWLALDVDNMPLFIWLDHVPRMTEVCRVHAGGLTGALVCAALSCW